MEDMLNLYEGYIRAGLLSRRITLQCIRSGNSSPTPSNPPAVPLLARAVFSRRIPFPSDDPLMN